MNHGTTAKLLAPSSFISDTETVNIQGPYEQFPASENPLSSDVFLIRGKNGNYVFDTGANGEALSFLNGIEDKIVVLSHFHRDHTTNVGKIDCKKLYGGKQTCSYLKVGEIVDSPLVLESGIEIVPVTSCHAKGSLALKIADSYLLVGDLLCGCETKNGYGYNAGMLLSTIRELKAIETEFVIPSHSGKVLLKKDAVCMLEDIYGRRQGNEPYIVL